MKWRIISLEAHDAFTNMAIDEAILEGLIAGTSQPTIRFYTWKPGAVSIGRFQSLENEVNVEQCKSFGVDVVRRLTGGGAVYHDAEGEVTYSILAPESMFRRGIRESYSEICASVVGGLEKLGIEAQFVPINDIVTKGKKISGNAQVRRNGMLLQHGTILYKTNLERMFSVLKVSNEKISDKMIKSAKERVTSVTEQSTVTRTALYMALRSSFSEGRECENTGLVPEEKQTVEMLYDHYKSWDWNFER